MMTGSFSVKDTFLRSLGLHTLPFEASDFLSVSVVLVSGCVRGGCGCGGGDRDVAAVAVDATTGEAGDAAAAPATGTCNDGCVAAGTADARELSRLVWTTTGWMGSAAEELPLQSLEGENHA